MKLVWKAFKEIKKVIMLMALCLGLLRKLLPQSSVAKRKTQKQNNKRKKTTKSATLLLNYNKLYPNTTQKLIK